MDLIKILFQKAIASLKVDITYSWTAVQTFWKQLGPMPL